MLESIKNHIKNNRAKYAYALGVVSTFVGLAALANSEFGQRLIEEDRNNSFPPSSGTGNG